MSNSIFKAYDIRGLVEDELTADFSFAAGLSYARFLKDEREPATVVIGEDMRPSSPELADAFSAGVMSQGFDVIRIGLASTDMLYFAAGKLNLPGAMFTASHNPAAYNGIKLCLSGARPVGKESGLLRIEKYMSEGSPISTTQVGVERREDMLADYVGHLHSLVDTTGIRRLKIVVDAGNGMAGHTAPAVFASMNAEIIELYYELDGTFPNHEANPIDPANLRDLQKAVRSHKADIGLAFDGDAAIVLVHAGQLDAYHHVLAGFLHFAGQQAPARESGEGTSGRCFHLIARSIFTFEMSQRFAASGEQFTPAFRQIFPGAIDLTANVLASLL